MKILIVSDIHSNWSALSAIEEKFDVCLCAGDLVDYGTDPVPCLKWVRETVYAVVRGNHDHAVAQRIPPMEGTGMRELVAATRPLHWKLLKNSELSLLGRLPLTSYFRLGEKQFMMVHASLRDPLNEYLVDDPQAWEKQLRNIEADFVIAGHSHLPFHLDLGKTQVINPGSVGQPRDGDPRASYVVIDNGTVEFRRVAYDIDATLKQMNDVGVLESAIDLAESILRNGGL